MINPVNHANTAEKIALYRVEPYVVAADVYSLPPHTGRGGWTWYTGSAGWMYRLIVESLLGIEREADRLRISPSLPADWKGFKFSYRYGETSYDVTVSRTADPSDEPSLRVDGELQADNAIALTDDRIAHVVEVRARAAPQSNDSSAV